MKRDLSLLSGVYNKSAGQAWGRRATIRGLSQGTETVRIETRGTRRQPLAKPNVPGIIRPFQ
jgi:hypothetical protein